MSRLSVFKQRPSKHSHGIEKAPETPPPEEHNRNGPTEHKDEDEDEEPFGDLRYKAPPAVEQPPAKPSKVVKVSVYKANKFWRLSDIRSTSARPHSSSTNEGTHRSSRMMSFTSHKSLLTRAGDKDKHSGAQNAFLSPCMISPEKMTVCDNVIEDFITPPRSVYIKKPRKDSESLKAELSASLKKESHSLNAHRKKKHEQLQQENIMVKKSGKDRGHLLLRRHQVLPRICETNLERTVIPVERSVTPQKLPDWVLWAPIIYETKEKNGISPQLLKRQRGYDVVNDWVGHPEITDEIRKELRLNEEHAAASLVDNKEEEPVCTEERQGRCLPAFQRLGVVGFNYDKLQHKLREPVRKLVLLGNDQPDDHAQTALQAYEDDTESFHPYPEMNPPSRVSLSVGHVNLFWTTDPQRAKETKVVELGCSAEPNKHSIDYVLMRNTGTTVIRFSWYKKEAANAYGILRVDQMHMIFDYSNGVILPGEVYRIPFMYKAVTPGQFSEDWRLLTQPVLENGAEIILRLWGFMRLSDQQSATRKSVEDHLRRTMGVSIAKCIIGELVDTLPIEAEFYDPKSRPQLLLKGADLFVFNNPWLYYKSSPVDCLSRVDVVVGNELKKQNKITLSSTNVVEGGDTKSGTSLTTYQDDSSGSGGSSHPELNGSGNGSQSSSVEDDSSSTSHRDVADSLSTVFNQILFELQEVGSNPAADPPTVPNDRIKSTSHTSSTSDLSSQRSGSSQESVQKNRTKEKRHLIIDPSIVVNSMRQDILQCKTNILRQEILFAIFSEEVDCLQFKPFYPCENWKLPVVKGLFTKAVQEFETYATNLQTSCYAAKDVVDRVKEQRDNRWTYYAERATIDNASTVPSEATLTTRKHPSTGNVESSQDLSIIDEGENTPNPPCPRDDLEPERYEQYYSRLYARMYWLLSDMFDHFDSLIHHTPKIDPRYGKDVFIKIGKVPLNVDMKHELLKPLPPKWVNILHKMNMIRRKKRQHREVLEQNSSMD